MSDLAKRLAGLSPEKLALLERQLQVKQRSAGSRPAPIAIIGIGCRFPGSGYSHRAFWETLVDGVDTIREVPANRWDAGELYDEDATVRGKMATRWGGFLDDVENFDPLFFDLTNREATRMDPQQRLFMETTWSALEDAGLVAANLAGSATGVFVSAHNLSSDYFLRQSANYADIDPYSATGGAHSIIANRLSYWLDLQGPSLTVDTACSGSLVAAHLAINSLRSEECDIAIAGGVNLMLSPQATIALSGLQMMASDGRCKTFDARADGFVRGEGCGAVILKRLVDAQRDGDAVYAVIRGSAVNQDGRTNGLTAPNGVSQQRVLRQALKQADVSGAQVGFVEAHGTGTAMGDPIEVEALTEVVGRPGNGIRCVLGSVKTNIGHLESAAGIAGLIKTALCLHHEHIPPNLHFTELNPHIDFAETRFVVPIEGVSWPASGDSRFAGVSSFGFGGTNAHMVLEEAPRDGAAMQPGAGLLKESLLVLSARDQGALKGLAAAYSDVLSAGNLSYQDICYTAACRRTHFEWRLAVHASNAGEAAAALQSYLSDTAAPEVKESRTPDGGDQQVVWVFSGQGSQCAGMGQKLLDTEPVFRRAIERIDEFFSPLAGWSILNELQTADDERLGRTEIAQPAIFAIEIALAALLQHYGIQPTAVVGHSLGEVAAAHVSGALDLEDAVTVIYHRGRLMQSLHGAGRMAAVFAREREVRKALAVRKDELSIAAVNGPLSLTISGDPQAIKLFGERADFPHQILPVQYAFHSAQMEPIKEQLASALVGIRARDPVISVYSTVRGGMTERGDFGSEYWARNIREPVAFADVIESIASKGTACFVELGPRAVLGPAIEQCVEAANSDATVLGALLRDRPEQVREILAALHVNGVSVSWSEYFGENGRTVRLPTYPWQRRRCWFDPTPYSLEHSARQPDIDEWFYDVAWPLRTPLGSWIERAPIAEGPSLETVSSAVQAQRDTIYRKHGAEDSRELVIALEAFAADYAASALRELGFALKEGDSYPIEDLAGIGEGYRNRIVMRLFHLLEKQGAVRKSTQAWVVCGGLPKVDQPSTLSAQDDSAVSEVLELLQRCGREVANVVLGKCDPLALLFPGDYSTSAEWIYADAPFSRVANDLVAETVAALIEQLPESQTLRILEVGAGTGGTTRTVLPRLRSDRMEYVFTDLSKSFLSQANEKFRGELPIHYKLLDVEADPVGQGFGARQFDLIIAANVIHATADLRRVLHNVRELLVPGGTLLMLEGTARRGWIDLTFGLTEGWWRFTDTDLRADHPLLSATAWQALLLETGFAEAEAIPAQCDAAGSFFEQAILIARAPVERRVVETPAPTQSATSSAPWIVLADQNGVGEALATQVRAAGRACIVVEQTKGAVPTAAHTYQLNSGSRTDVVELLQTIRQEYGCDPQVIVHLVATDEQVETDAAADWNATMTRSCGSVLHLVQALEETGIRPERGVWVVTRGVQPIMLGSHETTIAQAPLWGLGRVAAREKPEIWGGLVDLDYDVNAERDARELCALIDGERDENQIALRSGDRFVARLVRSQPVVTTAPELVGDRSYLVVGGLGNIGLQVAQWMILRGARHLTLLSRRGLPSVADGIRDLEAIGATITVIAADAADPERMADVFAAFGRERPPLAGVVHTAAVVDFQPLEQIELDDLLAILRSKVAGSWVLHELTAGLDLDFFILFSSLAAIAGFPQLSHYAAANSFQDGLAHRRHELGLPALSVNWGLWSDGQSTNDINRALFQKVGLLEMPTSSALQGLERVFGNDLAQQTIAWIDWESFRPIYESRGASNFLEVLPDATQMRGAAISQPSVESARERLSKLPHREAIELLQDVLRSEVAAILAVSAVGLKGCTDGFFEMGMDSIMTVELKRRLEATLDCSLPTTVAFEYPTIDRLSDFIARDVLSLEIEPQQESASSAIRDRSSDDDLGELSADDLREMLDNELAAQSGGVRGEDL